MLKFRKILALIAIWGSAGTVLAFIVNWIVGDNIPVAMTWKFIIWPPFIFLWGFREYRKVKFLQKLEEYGIEERDISDYEK
jgi:hypothetical protein